MGTALSHLCLEGPPTLKPTQERHGCDLNSSTLPHTPVNSLKRLTVKSKTLPVILEEESSSSPTPTLPQKRATGRMGFKGMVVNKRLKQGFRRGKTNAE